MLNKDVIYSKISIIKNCLKTIEQVTKLDPQNLDDIFIQDVFVLNIQRAVQACIDASNSIIAEKGLKLPITYKESFQLLQKNRIIEKDLAEKMSSMVGLRNIAVNDYQQINVEILKSIITRHLTVFKDYISKIYKYVKADKRET